MIYLIMVAVITVIAVGMGFYCDDPTRKKVFIWIAFSIIGILIAFRNKTVGADTLTYYNAYLEVASQKIGDGLSFNNSSIESGYLLLLQVLNHLSSNPQTMFLFEGILIAFSYGWFIIRNTASIADAYIAIIAYLSFNLFSFQLTGYRQSIAMAICMFAYLFLEKRKIIPFLLIVILAAQFHASAYFFILAYFISIGKANKLKLSIVALLGLLIRARLSYFNYLMSLVSSRYDKYGIEETGNGMVFFAILLLILFAAEFYKKYIIYNDEENQVVSGSDIFYSVNYATCLLWFLRLFTRTAERPCLFYIPATIIVLKEVSNVRIFTVRDKDITRIVVSLVLLILFIYRMRSIFYSFCF